MAAANDWLPIFRTEQVDPIEVTTSELVQLPDLSAYGDLEVTQQADPQPVADADGRGRTHRPRRPRGDRRSPTASPAIRPTRRPGS